MEKAILKTLIYADIFDYPLLAYEIHKWLISKTATLQQVEKALERLSKKLKVKSKKGYYSLPGRNGIINKRQQREKQSERYLLKAKITTWLLKAIPFIKLVGISGGLAMENAGRKDDIDLFIITKKNRIWLTRLLVIGLLDLMGSRRKAKMKASQVAGKLCTNILVEEDKLEQANKDIFTAHEILQMKPLWYRNGIYQQYLQDNQWVFKFLPNWIGNNTSSPRPLRREASRRGSNSESDFVKWIPSLFSVGAHAVMTMEKLAKWLQLKLMAEPQGKERIEEGALYFHPKDCRLDILDLYKKRLKFLFH